MRLCIGLDWFLSVRQMDRKFKIAHLNDIEPVRCPCGFTRRAFVEPDNPVASIHLVDIQEDAQTHYHKKLTEIYLILIQPGCRHKAVGKMKIVNMPVPTFDPEDEWFD